MSTIWNTFADAPVIVDNPLPPPEITAKHILAVGPSGIFYSDDGVSWTESDDSSQFAARGHGYGCCTYSPVAGWVVSGGTGSTPSQAIITSPDGITWTYRPSPWDGIGGGVGMAYSPSLNLIVAVSNYNDTMGIMTSQDGITWTERSSPWDLSGELLSVIWVPFLNKFFVGSISSSSDATPVPLIGSSSNGITWTGISTPSDPPHHSGPPFSSALMFGFAHSNNLMMAMGDLYPTQNVMTSPDGTTFTIQSTVPSPIPVSADTYNGAYHGGVWVVGTNSAHKEILKSTDNGVTWTGTYDSGLTGPTFVQKVLWSPTLNKFIGVGDAGMTTSPDGSTWTDVLDSNILNSDLWDIWDVLAT